MPAKTLRIADDLVLPLDFVTKTCAILAQRRKGKTYTASVLAEELVDAGQPWVALDPTGAWWGLRALANGESDGLPVVILGGQHGDAPLERSAGKFVAELVVESPGWYVLDLSLFESRAAEREFATDFGEALLRRKRRPGRDFPMHLFVDEADMFAPQEKEGAGDARMLGAYQGIVRRGGLAGLGSTLISQRPALLNKSVLTQLDILVLLRLVAGQDQDAVDKSYLSRAGSRERRAEVMDSLASLGLGEAWVWEPGAEPPLFQRLRIRERRTFNSSATPKPGEQRVEPRRLADVDLDAVKEAMGAAIERAKADDPKELRRRIAELERELRAAAQSATVAEPVVEYVEVEKPVPFVPPAVVEWFGSHRAALSEQLAQLDDVAGEIAVASLRSPEVQHDRRQDVPGTGRPGGGGRAVAARTAVRARQRDDQPGRREPRRAAVPRAAAPEGLNLRAGERKMLAVLASRHPLWVTKAQLGALAKFKPSGGTFRTYLGVLKGADLVEVNGNELQITDAGLAVVGDEAAQPQTTEELLAMWRSALRKGERDMLDALVEVYPSGLDRSVLAEQTGFEVTGGTFRTYLGVLKSNGLIEVEGQTVRASEALFL